MKQLKVAAVLAALVLLLGSKGHSLQDTWMPDGYRAEKFQKLIIVGITQDQPTRRRFEDRFVSWVRGKGLGGVTSYSIVPDLGNVEDRNRVIEAIAEQRIDGAISVRLVPLPKNGETDWAAAWTQAVESDQKLSDVIARALPDSTVKAKQYGIEVSLWKGPEWVRIWSARTDTYTHKELQKGKAAGEFVDMVTYRLAYDDLM